MLFYKKQAFTLAETIMTLFIVGVVVMAAIPTFTMRKGDVQSIDTPWNYANTTLNIGLKTDSPIVIGAKAPASYKVLSTSDAILYLYNLTINDTSATAATSTLYDIFQSDKRNLKIGNYYFYEDLFRNLFITTDITATPAGCENNVIIGSANLNNTIKNNVSIGTDNTIAVNADNNVLFGNNITANGDNSTGFGQGINLAGSDVVIGTAEQKVSITANIMNIGNHITATNINATPTVTFNADTTITDTISGTSTVSSDIRLKNIKGKYKKGLKEILQINPVIFQYKADKSGSLRVGVIAQEVQKVFPEAVVTMNDGYLGVNSAPMFFASINALKEINAQKNIEKARQEKLEKELKQLEKELAQLKPTFWDKIWSFLTRLTGGNHA